MTPLEALWAATTQAEADQARTDAWSSLTFPIVSGTITITHMSLNLPVVEFHGEGGTVDWPLRLIGAPLGVRDPDGVEIDADGNPWRTDPLSVLVSVLVRFQ
jgi:hypothetical protein